MEFKPAVALRWLIVFVAIASATATTEVSGQASPDVAFEDEIEAMTRRDTEGLVPRIGPDGSVAVDLQGRFSHIKVGRIGDDGEVFVGCVGTLDEAKHFATRDLHDLRGIKARVPATSTSGVESLASRASRHGMTPTQLRYYESLIGRAAPPDQGKAATITILNADDPFIGFNDPSPVAPVGGNAGTTLGQQRLNALNRAAAIWSDALDSRIPIEVAARFAQLPCTSSLAVIFSSISPGTLVRVDSGIVSEPTVFPVALYNKLAGIDGNGPAPEIEATFSASIDNGCIPGFRFYYGFDDAPPDTASFLVSALHDLAHGVGFASYITEFGTFPLNAPDIWARFQFERSTGLLWSQMDAFSRADSAVGFLSFAELSWIGPNVGINSFARLYTPSVFVPGFSVSHWFVEGVAYRDQLMQPSEPSRLPQENDLTRQLLRDIGWYRDTDNDGTPDTITNVQPSGTTFNLGSLVDIRWTNNGGFNRNVDIELSNDGGATFPTVIARNVANTGSFPWFSPSTPITQGRIRVRETGFAEPGAISAGNFTNNNTPPTFTPAAAVNRQQGSPAGAAVAIGTVSDTTTPAGSLTVTEFIGGTATGITVGGITNTNGLVTATLAASCTATAGTVRFRVTDGVALSNGFGNLQVNLIANTPPTLTYSAQSGVAGAALTVVPASGPSDNGTVTTSLLSRGSYTGAVSVGPGGGVVSLSNLAPVGTHTITVRVTDNCGATRDASFQLTVTPDPAPTFTPAAAITRQQGSQPGAAATIGTVTDTQTAAGLLTVTQVDGGSATGVLIGGITNSNGTIRASVFAGCSATSGTVRFQVSDGTLTGIGDLQVNVDANTRPTLTYPPASGTAGSTLSVNPTTGPSDNGFITTLFVISQGLFTGQVSADPVSGVVSLANLNPVGSHNIVVSVSDNCGASVSAILPLSVNAPANTAPTFTSAAAVTRQQGSLSGAAVAIGTVADTQTAAGSLTVTQVAGGTATGITVGGITNSGGAITATLAASCAATAGTVRFQVSDGTLTSTGDLQVNVLPNTPPALTYGAQFVASGGTRTVNPATGPTDNGPATTTALLNAGTYTGTVSVGASNGVVSLSNAAPIALHTITVRATDNCGATTDAPVSVQVNGDAVFGSGFEPVLTEPN